jgi:polygalacturonase
LEFWKTFPDFSILQGHGISIGSISSGSIVSDVTISNNTVTDSFYGLRIKTDEGATDASGQFSASMAK